MYQVVLWSVSGRVLVNVPGGTMECFRFNDRVCCQEVCLVIYIFVQFVEC